MEGFKERVKEWWESFSATGRPGYILAEKLKMLKVKLKEWSKNNRGNLETKEGRYSKSNFKRCQHVPNLTSKRLPLNYSISSDPTLLLQLVEE